MSTLTKVFVVLLVVFSIAFTSMTVSIVAQTTNWRDTALKYEENARIAETNLRHSHAACAAQVATATDEVRQHLDRVGELEAKLQTTQNDANRLRAEAEQAGAEKSSAEAMNRGLLAQLQSAEAGRSEYRRQRDDLERHNMELERRNIDLSDRVNELTATVDVLVEQRRQYEQQINILKKENERLALRSNAASGTVSFEAAESAGMTGVTPMTPVAERSIRGRVLEIAGDLVSISVGSADGVQPEMIFVVHRGNEYVGDVQISEVEPNRSAGRLIRFRERPIVGDAITDSATMSGSR